MGWNYRAMRHSSKKESTTEGAVWFGIHELYYRTDEINDLTVAADETGYTQEPIKLVADDDDGLRWMLEQMLAGLEKPILEYEGS